MANGLGRGLGSLIPQKINKPVSADPAEDVLNEEDKDKVLKISIEKITVNPSQPRKRFTDVKLEELVESIRQFGIIQPLLVSQSGGGFELIAGERRLRAAKASGLKEVPVIVRETNSQDKLEVALIENIQRENLNPVEMAAAYKKLMDEFSLSQEETAKRLGKSRSAVANTLRILSLPEEIQLAMIDGKISEGHAKVITGLDTEAKQMKLFRQIQNTGLSVHDAARETRRMGGTKQARVEINYTDKDKEFAFRQFFGTKVEIRRSRKGGQVIIDFFSNEELDNFVNKIK